MSNIDEYKSDVAVDPDSLPWEWGRQSSVYLKYGKMMAEAGRVKDKAKESWEVAVHKAKLNVCKNKEDYDLPSNAKVGEIDAVVALEDDVREAYDHYLDEKYEFDLLKQALRALEHKKTSLEYTTELVLKGYGADPRISKEIQDLYADTSGEEERNALRKSTRLKDRKSERKLKRKTERKTENG